MWAELPPSQPAPASHLRLCGAKSWKGSSKEGPWHVLKWEALWEKRCLTRSGSIGPPGDLRSPVLFPPPDTTVRRFASLLPFSKRTKG